MTLVVSSLAPGGAERVLATLANHFASDGHHVTLITLASALEDGQRLDAAITRVALDLVARSTTPAHAVRNNWLRFSRLRARIRRSHPEVVVSFLSTTNILTLAATRRLAVPVVVAERIDPREEPIGPVWAGLRRILYPRADALVVQTSDVAGWASGFMKAGKVHVIPNPVRSAEWLSAPVDSAAPEWLARPGRKVLAMGRLAAQKGFDVLLRAFALCHRSHPQWSLIILGEGDERQRLEALADDLGIRSRVALPGYFAHPAAALHRADLFVLASRYEGFPNALLEAMACGLPVIATDCPSGPRHIIRDGIDGLLVPRESVDDLSAAMHQLMSAPDRRRQLGARAIEVRERFSPHIVMRQWSDLLARCSQP